MHHRENRHHAIHVFLRHVVALCEQRHVHALQRTRSRPARHQIGPGLDAPTLGLDLANLEPAPSTVARAHSGSLKQISTLLQTSLSLMGLVWRRS